MDLRILPVSAALLVFSASGLMAQESAATSRKDGNRDGVATANVTIRLQVVEANSVRFGRLGRPNAATAEIRDGQITIEATRPGELAIEVWRRPAQARGVERGELLAVGQVHLESDASGRRARGVVPAEVATTLEAAAERPGVYTIVVAY